MATQSLYRRYRPRRFSELKGQDHVVRALRTSVAEGREGQAYLFSGPRGTGKTTSARILAKVLNCENVIDGEPCCACESCLAVERGTSYDVHELDAASNNGVDAMRDLIEKASLGTPGRHKVYILDEVHMLTKGAEAALLKTLEEPPPHVVFVLATTDPQKMSDTIISRTQHLQFHLLAADTLAEHARWVADDAGLDISDAALEQALSRGRGSARDTLSALELVASTGDDALATVPLDEFVEAMIDRDAGRALTLVAHAMATGMDARTLAEELIGHLRNGFLVLMAPELVQLPSQRLDDLADRARRLGAAGLVRGIEHLGTALVEMRHAPDPRVLLEVATVQLTVDDVAPDLGSLLARLDRLERQMAEAPAAAVAAVPAAPVDPATGRAALGGRARTPATPAAAETAPAPNAAPEAGSAVGRPTPGAGTADRAVESARSDVPAGPDGAPAAPPAEPVPSAAADAVETIRPAPGGSTPGGAGAGLTADDWENAVRPSLRGMARAVYAPANFVRSTPTTLTLSVPNAVHRGKCEQQRPAVESAVSAHVGAPVSIELEDDGDSGGGGGPGGGSPSLTAGQQAPSSPDDGVAPSAPESRGPSPRARAEAARAEGRGPVDDDMPEEFVVTDLPDDHEVDLDDLVDAPPESVKTPIDRLAEAFPGSELIEDVG